MRVSPKQHKKNCEEAHQLFWGNHPKHKGRFFSQPEIAVLQKTTRTNIYYRLKCWKKYAS